MRPLLSRPPARESSGLQWKRVQPLNLCPGHVQAQALIDGANDPPSRLCLLHASVNAYASARATAVATGWCPAFRAPLPANEAQATVLTAASTLASGSLSVHLAPRRVRAWAPSPRQAGFRAPMSRIVCVHAPQGVGYARWCARWRQRACGLGLRWARQPHSRVCLRAGAGPMVGRVGGGQHRRRATGAVMKALSRLPTFRCAAGVWDGGGDRGPSRPVTRSAQGCRG